MCRIRLIILFLIVSAIGIAQESHQGKKKISFRKQLKASTKVQINQLKNGALLVSLKTNKSKIAALKKIGRNDQAQALEEKQRQLNKSILAAFKAKFNFCTTYFFFSDYAIYAKERAFDKVVFLNDSLIPDSNIMFQNKTFLVASFGKLEQDTAKHLSHYTLASDNNFSVTQVRNYYGGPNMGFDALIISSDKFIQLRRPFPYYVRTRDAMPKSKVIFKTVAKMNKKLHRFYLKKNKSD
jgi:hypothetical protein